MNKANMSNFENDHAMMVEQFIDIVKTVDWDDPQCIDNVAELARRLEVDRSIKDWTIEFLNSRDVAEYLRSVPYHLFYSEIAWIVYQSRHKSLYEKICVWSCIAVESDQEIDNQKSWGQKWSQKFKSLSEALSYFLPRLVRAIDAFYQARDGELYQYRALSPQGEEWASWDAAFSTFNRCVTQAEHDLADETSPKRVQIRKRVLDTWSEHGETTFLDGVLVNLSSGWENDDDLGDMEQFFESMWHPISTPFKKGDVLYDPWCFKCAPLSGGGPIVVENFAYEFFEGEAPAGADSFDMSVMGYFQREDGSIFYEVLPGYLNLERCPDELLTGSRVIMKVLGQYLKGECHLDKFANQCGISLLESILQDIAPTLEAPVQEIED